MIFGHTGRYKSPLQVLLFFFFKSSDSCSSLAERFMQIYFPSFFLLPRIFGTFFGTDFLYVHIFDENESHSFNAEMSVQIYFPSIFLLLRIYGTVLSHTFFMFTSLIKMNLAVSKLEGLRKFIFPHFSH
jgi:hypothetical protein